MQHLVEVTRKNAILDENLTFDIIDSQSVQNVSVSEQSGYDSGKKNGIKTGSHRQNRLFTRRCCTQGKAFFIIKIFRWTLKGS